MRSGGGARRRGETKLTKRMGIGCCKRAARVTTVMFLQKYRPRQSFRREYMLSSILRNTLNLETLGVHQCKFVGSRPKKRTPSKRHGSRTTDLHQYKNLKLIEIKSRQGDAPQILRLLSEVSKEMPLAQWRHVNQASDVAGLTTMQFHRTEKGGKLV